MLLKKICINCQKIFYVKPSHYKNRFCCCKKCQSESQKWKLIGNKNPNWKKGISFKKKKCPICGKIFLSYKQKTCSRKCGNKTLAKKAKKRFCEKCGCHMKKYNYNKLCKKCRPLKLKKAKIYYCIICKKQITKKATYCRKCYFDKKAKTKIEAKCDNCGKKFIAYGCYYKMQINHFCCKKCYAEYQKKSENNPNWRGGISSKNSTIRRSKKMIEWRNTIFKRDNWTCQICKQKGGELHAHHQKSFSLYPKLRFDIKNGITLCKKCHNEIPKITKSQFVVINKIKQKLINDIAETLILKQQSKKLLFLIINNKIIIALPKGITLIIQIKISGSNLTKHQAKWQEKCNELKHIYWIVRSVKEFEKILKKFNL